MKVAVTSSSRFNLYASSLIARLRQRGVRVEAVICTERSRTAQLRDYTRRHGVAAAIRKLLEVYNVGSERGSALQNELSAYARQHTLTGWNSSLPSLAARHAIRYLSARGINAPEVVSFVRGAEIDLLLNAGAEIFRRDIIGAVRRGILNGHMGYLPTYRGYNVLEWSLFAGHQVGVTLHFIDTGIDTGDILRFVPIPVEAGDTIESLRAKSYPVKIDLMAWAIDALDAGCHRTSQRPSEGRQYFAMHPRLRAVAEAKIDRPFTPPAPQEPATYADHAGGR